MPVADGVKHFFCGEAVKPGKPYCTHHCKQAYVRLMVTAKNEQSGNW